MLWYARLHPNLRTKPATFVVLVNIILCWICVMLAVKGIFVSHNHDIFIMAEYLQTCFLMTHATGKILVLHTNRKNLSELLEKKSMFWKISDVKDDALYTECFKIFHVVKRIIRIHFFVTTSVAIFFDLQPFTTESVPTLCYVPEGWFIYLTVMMWYLSCMVLFSLPGTDCFFCSLGSTLIVQYKLLESKFKNMADKNYEKHLWKEMKYLINYHDFLLSYCKELNRIYRAAFLLQFIMSIGSASVSVFIFMQPGDWSNRIKFLLYFVATIVQTGFYCVPLEMILNIAQNIDTAVYESKWYEVQKNQLKKSITLVIIRAQKPLNFSAYGLIDMNLRTYVLICKTVFSFYTYLNSVCKLGVK